MDQQASTLPTDSTPPRHASPIGVLVGVIILLGIVLLGALYVWGAKLEKERQMQLAGEDRSIEENSMGGRQYAAGTRVAAGESGITFIVPEGTVAEQLSDESLVFYDPTIISSHGLFMVSILTTDLNIQTLAAPEALQQLASSTITQLGTVVDPEYPITFKDGGIAYVVKDPFGLHFIRYLPEQNVAVLIQAGEPEYNDSAAFRTFLQQIEY